MSDIETRLLRYFVAVAEEQHFARAAMRLGITGPTLTHQIQKLEDQLGAKLLKRRGNTHVEITEAGARFIDVARPVLRQIDEMRFVAQRTARGEIGRIDIGFMPSVTCAGLIDKMLGGFLRENPAIEINLHRMVPIAQVAAIARKELDVGFTREPHKYPAGLGGFEVYRQPMVLALPRDHRLAKQKKIKPSALKDEVFINTGPELEVGFWGHTQSVAQMGKFTPRVAKRTDDLVTLVTYVSMGCGIGVLPLSMTRIDAPNVVYREFDADPAPTSTIAFIYRLGDVSPVAELLTKYVRRHAASG